MRGPVRACATVLAATLLLASTVTQALAVEADIIGTVYDRATEQPLEGVLVQAFDAQAAYDGNPGVPLAETTTDDDGSYSIHVPDQFCVYAYSDLTGAYRDLTTFGRGLPIENAIAARALEPTVTIDVYLPDLLSLVGSRTNRLGGTDRYATAAQIAAYNFGAADTVIVASGANFPDALAAAPLAGLFGAPILLTRPAALPPVVAQEIEALGATQAVIVGGQGAVSAGVEAALDAMGLDVVRVAGSDRYETSAMIVHAVVAAHIDAGVPVPSPFVCRGDAFPDALSASPFAFNQIRPILLTRPTSLPPASQAAWYEASENNGEVDAYAVLVGGEGAIADSVAQDLADASYQQSLYWGRIAGNDRYGTSVAMVQAWESAFDVLGLATGTTYPDALTGGAAAGWLGGALLLTPGTALHTAVATELGYHGPYVIELDAYGGTGAVSDGVLHAADAALGTSIYDINDPDHRIDVISAGVAAAGVRSAGFEPVGVTALLGSSRSHETGARRPVQRPTLRPAEEPALDLHKTPASR